MLRSSSRAIVRSSVPLQLLLYCHIWYFALFFLVEILLFIYKTETLPYPTRNLVAEIILLLVLAGVEAVRNYFGRRGNLTETVGPLIFSAALTIPSILTTIYFLLWQTYVFRLEVIMCSIQIALLSLELIFSVIAIATFARAAPL